MSVTAFQNNLSFAVGDRLGLAFVSKAERPFRLVQAAVSGVILLRSYVCAVQGDRFSFSELVSRVHQHQVKRQTPGAERSQSPNQNI
jgi:hypothetical protein